MIEILILYFAILFAIGFYSRKREEGAEEYFLAGRSFGSIVLFFTLAATNFSAFTFLGFAGKAYKDGLGEYGVMAVGTSFMAIMFYLIGRKVWKLGRKHGYITPGEILEGKHNSRTLRHLFNGTMALFTLPYLAIQAVGAGFIINTMFPDISIKIGAVITMAVIAAYVISGGMRAAGWTDVFQGAFMIIAMLFAFLFIAHSLGGVKEASMASYEIMPSLFSRPGPNGYFTFQIYLSFFLLWIFADPMFPQIFSRFYTAKNEDSLRKAMYLYPLLISFFFLMPVMIGIWAHGSAINIANPDNVLPLMVKEYAPPAIFSITMVGALAALMSTADSQLLSLSTILTCDIFGKKVNHSRIITAVLALFAMAFVIFGYDPKAGIMGTLVKTTFSGLVVLAPSIIATLYWKKVTKWGCIASILGGESIVFLSAHVSIPTFGFLPAIIAIIFSTILLIVVSLLGRKIS